MTLLMLGGLRPNYGVRACDGMVDTFESWCFALQRNAYLPGTLVLVLQLWVARTHAQELQYQEW